MHPHCDGGVYDTWPANEGDPFCGLFESFTTSRFTTSRGAHMGRLYRTTLRTLLIGWYCGSPVKFDYSSISTRLDSFMKVIRIEPCGNEGHWHICTCARGDKRRCLELSTTSVRIRI